MNKPPLFSRIAILLKKLTDKLQLFQVGYFAEVFQKNNKINLSFQGKSLRYLLPMINFKLLSKTENFGRLTFTLVQHAGLPGTVEFPGMQEFQC